MALEKLSKSENNKFFNRTTMIILSPVLFLFICYLIPIEWKKYIENLFSNQNNNKLNLNNSDSTQINSQQTGKDAIDGLKNKEIFEKEQYFKNKFLVERNQELVEKLKDVNKKIYDFLSLTEFYNKYVKDQNILDKHKILKEKYYTYLNIERFAIPVYGSVNVGKSTLLNYILDLKNFLEIGIDITTRFLCIIRHNINYKTPVISNITIEKRDFLKYNIKKDSILSESENGYEYIKKYNKYFSLKENKGLKIEDKYFLLIEVDIPFFHGEFEKYAYLIEFIDIPGLNEIDSNIFKAENIYFNEIIPFIEPNYLFSIFLFETNNFHHKDAIEILMDFNDINYLDCVQEELKMEKYLRQIHINKVFKESLFILNQKDKNNKEGILPKFKDSLNGVFQTNKINVDLKENENILELNLKELNLELNRFNSFEDYINYSINNMKSSLMQSFVDNLNRDFELDLNFIDISKNEKVKLNEIEKKQLNKINKIISRNKLKDSQFKKLYEIFNNNILKLEKNKKKSNTLTELIKNKIKKMINSYLNIDELNNLKIQYQNYFREKGINDLESDYNGLIRKKKSKSSLKNPIKFINKLDKYMQELYDLKGNDNNKEINSLNNKFKEIKEYSSKKYLSSLLLIGEYSSGKSSFLNSIIGFNLNLLQTNFIECSKVAIIVRYTEKIDNITLFSAKLIENNKYGFYFIEDKLEAEGKLNVKNKIIELNKMQKLNYYILYTPIKAYDDLNLKMYLKNQIELIDFPGLGSNNNNDEVESEINKLLKSENGFIFVKNGKEFNVEQSNSLVNLIYSIASKNNFYFINNCLFVFTHPEDNENYNIEEVKKNLFETFDKQTINQCMIKRKSNRNQLNANKFIITKIDSPLYEDYMQFNELIDNFVIFTEKIIFNYKESKIKSSFYEYLDNFLNNDNYRYFAEEYSSLQIMDNNNIKKYEYLLGNLLKKNSINMEQKQKAKYLEYYLKIKKNKKLYSPFKDSNYDDAIQKLKIIIINNEIIRNEILNDKIFNFSKEISKSFGNIKNILLNKNISNIQEDFDLIKEKLNNIINKYKNIYAKVKEKISEEFNLTKTNIEKFKLDNFDYKKSKEIFEESINKNIKDYNDLIKDLDIHLSIQLDYLKNISKTEFNSLTNDERFNLYFKDISEEYFKIIEIIDIKKMESNEEFKKEDYKKYNYFDTEDYKDSFFSKPLKLVKGGYINYFGHDYTEDQRLYSVKIINEFKKNLNEKEKNFINKIEELNNELITRINKYQKFFNSKWDNFIKNKKRFLDLSKETIAFLEDELYK